MAIKRIKNSKAKYNVEALYAGESIDLKKIQEGLKQYNFLNRDHPLALRVLKDQYLVLTKFGVVIFWNIAEKFKQQLLKEISPYVKSKKPTYFYQEKTKVLAGMGTERVLFNRIYLDEISVEKIKIISFVLSQSVALNRYEEEIETNLVGLEAIMSKLKTEGRVFPKEKELLKRIGDIFLVKQTAVTHLSLFDKPDDVWESPELEKLYNRLNTELELQDRFDVLDEKMDFLSENTRMLMDFISQKRGNFLEVVVIWLIVVEIILFVVDILPRFWK